MPLDYGDLSESDEFSKLVEKLVGEGHPQKQAVAITYNYKRKQKHNSKHAVKRAIAKVWG
jgi:hypothetical protein